MELGVAGGWGEEQIAKEKISIEPRSGWWRQSEKLQYIVTMGEESKEQTCEEKVVVGWVRCGTLWGEID